MTHNNFIDLIRELATYSMLIIHVILWLSGNYLIPIIIGKFAIPLFLFASGMASYYSKSKIKGVLVESSVLFLMGCILNLTTLGLIIDRVRIFFYYGILQIIAINKILCYYLKKLKIKYLLILIPIFILIGIFLIGDFISFTYAIIGLIIIKYKEFNIRGTYYLGKLSLTIFISHHYIFFNLSLILNIFQSINVFVAIIILGITIDLYYLLSIFWSRINYKYTLNYLIKSTRRFVLK